MHGILLQNSIWIGRISTNVVQSGINISLMYQLHKFNLRLYVTAMFVI